MAEDKRQSNGSLPPVVSTDWLAERLDDPEVRILDASWYLPAAARDARAEFLDAHIPGARFFDLDRASDESSALPHMLPTESAFGAYMASLGVAADSIVVVYDGSGWNLSAPRAWWMLRTFGHPAVTVLDGGMKKWLREDRPLESGEPAPVVPPLQPFVPRLDQRRVADYAGVLANVCHPEERSHFCHPEERSHFCHPEERSHFCHPEERSDEGSAPVPEPKSYRRAQLVDMRPHGRFTGVDPEPRPALRGGHVPGGISLPFTSLVDAAEGTVLPLQSLRALLATAGVDTARPVIAMCGSGLSACSLALNLERLGVADVTIYDGSWAEWGARDDSPVE